MTKRLLNPAVDFYFHKENQWQSAITKLRTIILDCGLTEEVKWGCPCYQYEKTNIVLIHVFKEYCALLFFKGVLLGDAHKILIQQTENVQAARQIRFAHAREVTEKAALLKAYIYEAIEVEKAGLQVQLKTTAAFTMPQEFKEKLNKNSLLKKAFDSLTPGRQRAYLLHFAAAKQSATRAARVEKSIPKILDGKGLND
ncbi:MAG: DUF1801 domain-containing protein [Chitinophagaceae bacterium]